METILNESKVQLLKSAITKDGASLGEIRLYKALVFDNLFLIVYRIGDNSVRFVAFDNYEDAYDNFMLTVKLMLT